MERKQVQYLAGIRFFSVPLYKNGRGGVRWIICLHSSGARGRGSVASLTCRQLKVRTLVRQVLRGGGRRQRWEWGGLRRGSEPDLGSSSRRAICECPGVQAELSLPGTLSSHLICCNCWWRYVLDCASYRLGLPPKPSPSLPP